MSQGSHRPHDRTGQTRGVEFSSGARTYLRTIRRRWSRLQQLARVTPVRDVHLKKMSKLIMYRVNTWLCVR